MINNSNCNSNHTLLSFTCAMLVMLSASSTMISTGPNIIILSIIIFDNNNTNSSDTN